MARTALQLLAFLTAVALVSGTAIYLAAVFPALQN